MLKRIPHTYVIIFFIIILAAVLTWIIPGGKYETKKVMVNGSEKNVIDKDSFHYTESNAQTWQIFSALFSGFVKKADIIVFIFMVGGAFMVLAKTKAIDNGIFRFIRLTGDLKKKRFFGKINIDNIIIATIMTIFSLFGSIFGMGEETIPFIMILVPLAISMGYDSITGVSMVYFAAAMGFAGATLNPFTIGIAQGLAGIRPLFSGIEYRFFAWLIINTVGIIFILRYAKRIKASPEKSIVYKEDEYWRKNSEIKEIEVEKSSKRNAWIIFGVIVLSMFSFSYFNINTNIKIGNNYTFSGPILPVLSLLFLVTGFFSLRKSAHYFILVLLSFTIILLIIGVMGYGWYVSEIASLFFAMGIFAGIAGGFSSNKIAESFIEGMKDIASAAVVVGFAGGILEILNDGNIIDTILHAASNSMTGNGKIASISIMNFFQTGLNIFVPSGSGQAALTMPIMAPLSDLLGISRQAAVTAFQFGDGFTNMITPTSGVLIGVLGVAKIPYEKWFKFIYKFMIFIILLALILLLPTVTMKLNGF